MHPSKYDAFIDQLVATNTKEELNQLISANNSLLIPQLEERVLERIQANDLPADILPWITSLITRQLASQWLTLADEQYEAFLEQNKSWMLSDTAYQFLIDMAQHYTNDAEHIEHRIILLIDFAFQTYFSLENKQNRDRLLLGAIKLFSTEWLRKNFPKEWANFKQEIGIAYMRSKEGNRAQNVEAAIKAYQQALTLRTRHVMPIECALTQLLIGLAYQERIEGDRAQNIEAAVESFQQALIVFTQQAWPDKWAIIQFNLGDVYRKSIHGDRAQNLEMAIKSYQRALTVFTQQTEPYDWADIQQGLALAYQGRIEGDRAQNMEAAIEVYQQALTVFTRQTWPDKWADIQNNLGIAYQERIEGDRAQNLEKALESYQRAMIISARPDKWADTQNNLGIVYQNRIKGDRATNIELAIEAYQQALTVFSQQTWPDKWARTQNNLGSANLVRIRGGRAQNLEAAIEAFQLALIVRTQQSMSFEWANTQHNLGLAYSFRIQGDRAQNLEEAIEAYQQALTQFTQQAWPYDWATTQNTLGLAYFFRIRGDRAHNLETAIIAFQHALKVHTQQIWPVEWAGTQQNLGSAYSERIEGDRAQNVEMAIEAYQQALTVRSQQAMPYAWAETQHNLGNANRNRIHGDQAQNLEAAIQAYQLALVVRTQQTMPIEWATTQYVLGFTYQNRTKGDRAQNVEMAIEAYQQALTIFTPDLLPIQCFETSHLLGELFFQESQWTAARQALELAHQAAEHQRQQQYTYSRHLLAQQTANMYAYLVDICLNLGDKQAALDYALAAKGRSDAERLGAAQPLNQLVAQNPTMANYYQHIRQLQQKLEQLSIQLRSYSKPVAHNQRLDENDERQFRAQTIQQIIQTRLALRQALEELNFRFPLITSVQYTRSLTAANLIRLANDLEATLVQYFQCYRGWVAFIVTAHQVYDCVRLPETLQTILEEQVDTDAVLSSYQSKFPLKERLYFKSLYQRLIAPLEDFLPEKGQLFIAPDGILKRIPFGALWKHTSNNRLIDRFTFSVVPSMSFLFTLFQQAQTSEVTPLPPSDYLLSVVYPGDDPLLKTYLTEVYPESVAIAQHFIQVEWLHDEKAQPDRLIELCQQHAYSAIHFGCHGQFDNFFPEHSCLLLNGQLTVQQIVNRLRLQRSPLVTLGACQTGMTESTTGGDQTGLSQALFMAGAKTVLASLWSVNDESTRVLFEHFYRKRAEFGVSEAEALQYAQQQVRQYPEWQDAYYWAAYQIVGLPV
ncbi:CHAT domain-containing protein [Spirosoma foliorum]|uniref:CHAT domain-containing protein n=1 Tax=Spirosoma foliorum TaxID=2710596 RepID=A0A7G5GRL9_9BACT|nr:CHAT domain-containing protein [Spirosoma foliorum]QMW01511.1 CHAT domain-containing protein [Spirosoma foliorum]